jgi:Flp pilus assembly protein TadD
MRACSSAAAAGLIVTTLLLLAGCGDDKPEPAEVLKLAYRQGFEAMQAHDFVKAEQYLAEAAQLAPDDPYVTLNLGVAYQRLGELDKARAAYQRAAATGEGVKPARVTDPHYSGRTVADLARDNLASLPPP